MKKNQFGKTNGKNVPQFGTKAFGNNNPSKIGIKQQKQTAQSKKKMKKEESIKFEVGQTPDLFSQFNEITYHKFTIQEKKALRKKQMAKRVEKLNQIREPSSPIQAKIKPILMQKQKPESKMPPQIQIQMNETSSQDDLQSQIDKSNLRKQVSISAEPSKKQQQRKDQFKKNGRNKSNDENILRLPAQGVVNVNSEFTISSVGYNDPDQDLASQNSIISEEDSAFGDVTPAGEVPKKITRTEAKMQKQKMRGQGELLGNARNANNLSMSIANNGITYDTTETLKKPIGRQKTYGNKNQNYKPVVVTNTNSKQPLHRSPTHKSKGGSNLDIEDEKFFKVKQVKDANNGQMNKVYQNIPNATAIIDGRNSRNSSLNFTVDNQIENLSMNFGRNKFVKPKQSAKYKKEQSEVDVGSVASVISKSGGNFMMNYEIFAKQNRILAKSNPRDQAQNTARNRGRSPNSRFKDDIQPNHQISTSKSTIEVKFDPATHSEEQKKKNQRMINVYLQTPYKVLTIDQIKMKQKENQPVDSTEKLFRAENNLHIHTVLRSNYGDANLKMKQNQQLADEATQLLMNEAMSLTTKQYYRKQKSNVKNHMSKTRSSLQKDMSQTQYSEFKKESQTVKSPNMQKNIIDNDEVSENLSQVHLNRLKQQKIDLENNFKQRFFKQLNSQLEKKIDQVHQKSNFIQKQSNLFNIYGANNAHLLNFTISQSQLNGQMNTQPTVTGSFFLKDGSEKRASPSIEALPQTQQEVSNLLDHSGDETDLLINLVAVSQSMGFSKMEMKELQRKEKLLIRAEETLDILHNKIKDKITQGSQSQIQGAFKSARKDLNLRNIDKKIKTYQSKIDRKGNSNSNMNVIREHSPKLPKVKQRPSNFDKSNAAQGHISSQANSLIRSIEHDGEVKDYFDNKISLRRSIEQKLHYDISNIQSYSTSKDKKNIKLSLLSSTNIKRKKRDESSTEKILNDITVPQLQQSKQGRHHKTNNTEIMFPDIKNKPQMILEQSRDFSTSKPGSNLKVSQKPETFFPLKKSGTTKEQQQIKLSPVRSIRKQKDNLIHAYQKQMKGNMMKTDAPQINNSSSNVIMAYAGQVIHQKNYYEHKKNSQLAYQFMNKSPRPTNQQKIQNSDLDAPNNNTENSDRKLNMQILKGVLSQQRKLNRIISSGVKPNRSTKSSYSIKSENILFISPQKQQIVLPQITQSPVQGELQKPKIASPGQ